MTNFMIVVNITVLVLLCLVAMAALSCIVISSIKEKGEKKKYEDIVKTKCSRNCKEK